MANQHEEGLNQIERLIRDPITYFWPDHDLSSLEHQRALMAIKTDNNRLLAYNESIAYETLRNQLTNVNKKIGRTTTQIRIMIMDEIRRVVNESLGLG